MYDKKTINRLNDKPTTNRRVNLVGVEVQEDNWAKEWSKKNEKRVQISSFIKNQKILSEVDPPVFLLTNSSWINKLLNSDKQQTYLFFILSCQQSYVSESLNYKLGLIPSSEETLLIYSFAAKTSIFKPLQLVSFNPVLKNGKWKLI